MIAKRRPEDVICAAWDVVPHHIKITFISTLTIFMLTHFFMITNKLPNHDDLNQTFLSLYAPSSGRWLGSIQTTIRSVFSMPWVSGLFSSIYISLSACFVVLCFQITKPINCVLTAGLMATFPAVSATLGYINTADAYFLCLLLSCLGTYISDRFKYGFFVFPLFALLSLSIYQSYFSVSTGLMVGILILTALSRQMTLKQMVIKATKFVFGLVTGLVLYFLSIRMVNIDLVDYMNLNNMGRIPLSDLPKLIILAYKRAFLFFWGKSHTMTDYPILFHYDLTKVALRLSTIIVFSFVIALLGSIISSGLI